MDASSHTATQKPSSRTVNSFDGTEIHYDIYDADSRSLVLVVPGFWRDRNHPSMQRIGRFLNGLGYRAAIVDLRGHGDSGGRYGFNLHEHHDVAAVARDLLSCHPIERIVLMGFSVGGAISIATAARHDLPVSGLLLISPVADFALVAPRLNPFSVRRHIAFSQALRTPRFDWRLRLARKLRAVDDIANIHVPVLLIHVKNDWLVGHWHSIMLYERANEPRQMHIIDIPGNYHADRIFSAPGADLEPLIVEFLDRTAAGGEPEAEGVDLKQKTAR